MEKGYIQEAREALEKAVELDPNMVEAVVNLGKLYLRAFDMKEEAMVLLKRAQVLTPDSVFGNMSLGIAYLELKDYMKAEHCFWVAVKIKSNHFLPAINGLAVAKTHLKKTDEAIDVLKYGIRVDPTYEDFYINLSKLHYNEERPLEAIRVLEEYLSINKHAKAAKLLLRVIKRKMELLELAKTRLETPE
jgi:tetratricopeptide (TPR) repeat protein